MRSRILLVLLVATALVAGCTKPGADDPDDGTNGTPGGNGGTGGTGGSGGSGTATPEDFNLTDSGSIQGPFSRSWDIEVENVGFTNAMIHFTLTGVQAGAPPTARVNLVLADPDGATVLSGVAGVGGDGDAIEWTLTPAELPMAGTYVLTATAGSDTPAPVPSVGLANFDLLAMVEY